MIEVIYKDEKQGEKGGEGTFLPPKNIRQTGEPCENYRIYMEDYVYTFLKKKTDAEQNEEKEKTFLAVLTGESRWADGVTYVFIKGALAAENTEASAEHIDFTDETWQKIQTEMEKYFEGQEIAGWFLGGKSMPAEAGEVFRKVHLRYFGGGEKVLMLMDPAEQEEAFFRYENNFLVKQNGYYLYYEKNPGMQTYMQEKYPDFFGGDKETVPDEAVQAFRRIIKKKKTTEETEEKFSVFSYAATACLVMAVAAVGMQFYQNYHSVREQEARTEAVAAAVSEKNSAADLDEGEEDADSTATETANGDSVSAEAEDGDSETEQAGEKTMSEEERAIYREESDVRKAGRRVREAREEADAQSGSAGGRTEGGEANTEIDAGENNAEDAGENGAEDTGGNRVENSDGNSAENAAGNSIENIGENAAEQETAATAGSSYIIRPGDTLYQISMAQYGNMDKIEEICRLNDISEDEIIYPGQIIVLP